MNVSLTKHFRKIIDKLILSGRYASASEVVRAGLRLVEEREQKHQAELEALRLEVPPGLRIDPVRGYPYDR
ncbi:MAG: antitoxin ParD1/3/4 [Rhodothermales bacterium]|jgi:antitoxin ParD1/3/4